MVIERDARRFIYDLKDSTSSKTKFLQTVG